MLLLQKMKKARKISAFPSLLLLTSVQALADSAKTCLLLIGRCQTSYCAKTSLITEDMNDAPTKALTYLKRRMAEQMKWHGGPRLKSGQAP